MTRRELGELEAALLRLKSVRDELAANLMTLGVKKMESLEKRLALVQTHLVERALADNSKTPLPTHAEVALTIRDARAVLNLNQAQLAERLGVHFATVSRWERGVLSMRRSTWKLLLKLAAEGRRE